MMSKHTPGPWQTLAIGDSFEHLAVTDKDNLSLLTVVDEDGVKFAAVYNTADARLIAAAPDLLEQLKIARREIAALSQAYIAMVTNQATGLIDDPDHVLIAQADRDMLNGFDAAIAKAEVQP